MSKTEADNLLKIETSWLKKNKYFAGNKSGGISWSNSYLRNNYSVGIETFFDDEKGYLRIYYSQINENDKKSFDYRVELIPSECNFGGKRYWFICPLQKNNKPCNRRVNVLYKCGDYFGCRHCFNLTYKTRNENRRYKLYGLFKTLTLSEKIDEKKATIKRSFYRGKLTQKQRELYNLYDKIPDTRHLY